MTVPISQYVLKVHGWCNLACDHCYVYEHADQSWRVKPKAISHDTVVLAADRIREHAAAHRLTDVSVVLHGGEPLLLGRSQMRRLLEVLRSRIGPVAALDIRVHSNGVLLDTQWCDLFREYGVKVGISVDGDKAANDRHRTYADGRSSYTEVRAALSLLRRPEYRHIYAGILCTVDLANDPADVYHALIAQEPPSLDLLLPHATWANPPVRPDGSAIPYARWLLAVYRRWEQDGRPVPIRVFDSLLSAAQGGPSFTEALGVDPPTMLVIDTNGDWEQPDSMKTAFDGAPATGMNVLSHTVDEAMAHPVIAVARGGVAGLCATCRACPVAPVCGGGLYAHRYRPEPCGSRHHGAAIAEFDHPSAYCADLKVLITTVLAGGPVPAPRLPTPGGPARGASGPPPRAGAARPAHALAGEAVTALAAGPGDVSSFSALSAMRLSEVRSLVAAVAASEVGWRDADLRAATAKGWELLCELGRDHPHAVDAVLAYPFTYAWAVRCLRPPPGADADADRAHLAGLAAAAAYGAGTSAELLVPVRDGRLYLPAAGALTAGAGRGRARVVSVAPGRPPVARGGGGWQPARCLTEPPLDGVAVEDLDPFRDCHGWPVAARLPPPEWQAWRRDLAAAGAHLADTVPSYARVLAAGLRCVVPLRPADGSRRSATARQAFGAVAVARPADGSPVSELSELLLHEFQHVKLNAVLDLGGFFRPGRGVRLRVPWRDDPRPVEGVIHGLYAFLALAHLRQAEGRPARDAYLRYRSWVTGTAAELLRTRDTLTPAGTRFVSGLAAAAETAVT